MANTDTQQFYKILVNGHSCHRGNLQWSLPKLNTDGTYTPGAWHDVQGALVMCENGIHLCTWKQIWQKWMKINATIYHAEPAGEIIHGDEKSITRSARLLRPLADDQYPAWWIAMQAQVLALSNIRFFQPDGDPLPEWKLFTAPTWSEAYVAAADAADDTAEDVHGVNPAPWSIARNAADWGARVAIWEAARNVVYQTFWDVIRDTTWDMVNNMVYQAVKGIIWEMNRLVSGDTIWDAARDAALYISIEHTYDNVNIDKNHRAYIRRVWQAWTKGYAVLGDINGVLYVYAALPM